MSDFLILSTEKAAAPAASREALEAARRFSEDLGARGVLLDAERLRPSREGKRVVHREGTARVTTGPFADTLGAYWAVRAGSVDEAVALAQRLPLAPGERLEVRPVMKGQFEPGKMDKVGRVFAFGVLGNAPDERAWVRLMDRIDDETGDEFGPDFIAGLRLEAPATGRCLVNQRGAPVVLDGPFLESKEVIGGLFFMRLPSMDAAVAWASKTRFAALGAAEIREVWRS